MVSWKAMEYQRTGQLSKFYSDEAFVPLWWIAFVLVIAVCIDAVTDPIAAHITDGVRTSWGRRRPFLAVGSIVVGGIFLALWTPPCSNTGYYFLGA